MKDPTNYFTLFARKGWRCRFTHNYKKVMRNRIITVDNVTPFGFYGLPGDDPIHELWHIRKRWICWKPAVHGATKYAGEIWNLRGEQVK